MASRLNNLAAFHQKLASANRILAISGAGLSAASGLPTFRGAGGLWRNYEATDLATPEAFAEDPGLVWLFYAYVCVSSQHFPLAEHDTHPSTSAATWPSKLNPTPATLL